MLSCRIMFIAYYFSPTDQFDLSKVVGNGKRFISYEIINRLKALNDNKVLMQLRKDYLQKQIEKGQHHRVFFAFFPPLPVFFTCKPC